MTDWKQVLIDILVYTDLTIPEIANRLEVPTKEVKQLLLGESTNFNHEQAEKMLSIHALAISFKKNNGNGSKN